MSNLACVRRSFAPLCRRTAYINTMYIYRPALNAFALHAARYQRFHWGAHSIFYPTMAPDRHLVWNVCFEDYLVDSSLHCEWPAHRAQVSLSLSLSRFSYSLAHYTPNKKSCARIGAAFYGTPARGLISKCAGPSIRANVKLMATRANKLAALWQAACYYLVRLYLSLFWTLK